MGIFMNKIQYQLSKLHFGFIHNLGICFLDISADFTTTFMLFNEYPFLVSSSRLNV